MALSEQAQRFRASGEVRRTPRIHGYGSALPCPGVPIEARPLSALTEERRKRFGDHDIAFRRLLAGAPVYDELGRPLLDQEGREVRSKPEEYGPYIRIAVPGEDKPIEDRLSAIRRDYPDQIETDHRGAALLSMGVPPRQIDIIYDE